MAPKIFEISSHLCFGRRYSKQNTVASPTAGIKPAQQILRKKTVHFNIHANFSLTDSQKLTFKPCVNL